MHHLHKPLSFFWSVVGLIVLLVGVGSYFIFQSENISNDNLVAGTPERAYEYSFEIINSEADLGESLVIKKSAEVIKIINSKDVPLLDEQCYPTIESACTIYFKPLGQDADEKNHIVYFSVGQGLSNNVPSALFAYDIEEDRIELVVEREEGSSFSKVHVSPNGTYIAYDVGYRGGYCINTADIVILDISSKKEVVDTTYRASDLYLLTLFTKWNSDTSFTYEVWDWNGCTRGEEAQKAHERTIDIKGEVNIDKESASISRIPILTGLYRSSTSTESYSVAVVIINDELDMPSNLKDIPSSYKPMVIYSGDLGGDVALNENDGTFTYSMQEPQDTRYTIAVYTKKMNKEGAPFLLYSKSFLDTF